MGKTYREQCYNDKADRKKPYKRELHLQHDDDFDVEIGVEDSLDSETNS